MNVGSTTAARRITERMAAEPAQIFLKATCAAIVAGSSIFAALLLALVPEQPLRLLGPGGMILVAIAAWALLARARIRQGVYALTWGSWLVVSVGTFYTGGVLGMSVIIYPLIMFVLGWMIGTRAAVAAAVLSVAATLGLALAEITGVLPAPPPTPPLLRWFLQSAVFLYSLALFIAFTRSYQNRLDDLQRLGEELHDAQAVAHVGSWVYDLRADVMRLSAETCRIFGIPAGITGSYATYLARVEPDDRIGLEAAWKLAIAQRSSFDHEHRIRVGDAIRWVRQRARFEHDADGKAYRSIGTTQDITARKQAEDALRESEQRFRTVLQNVPNLAVQGYYADGTTFYWNRASEQLYGYGAEEALGKSQLDLIIPAEMREEVKVAIAHMAASGEPVPAAELSLQRKDGSRVPVFSSHARVHIPGHPPELFRIDIDLTAQKRQEAEVLATRNHLDATLQAIPDLLFEMDSDGRYHGFRSPRTDLLAAPTEQFLGKTVEEILPPAAADACMQALREADRTGYSVGKQYELALASGAMWFELSVARMLTREHDKARFVVLARDITERKRAEIERAGIETRLRESQKMEALGTLAGGIAHDFNNIIAAILGNAELARTDTGPGHVAYESLEEIRKASLRAKELVKQILAFSRRQRIERKPISLEPVVQESVRLLRATLPAGIELRIRCDPDTPRVLADSTQIAQILMNLCTNAWQAMGGQASPGIIEIRLGAHTVTQAVYNGPERRCSGDRPELAPGRYAYLRVRDNGPGMSPDTRSRMFEPFFTTRAPGEGSGLGLAVVHGIVRDHEAGIAVQTAPGGGTTFRIYFPEAEMRPADAAGSSARIPERAPAQARTAGAQKHVLYLDDDAAIVSLMTRLLRRRGYRVSGFSDPQAALAAVQADARGFDLAVTDYNMPKMSGLEFARQLQRIRADLPIALASGYITEELRAQAPTAGVRELLYKPDAAEDLCQAIARLAGASPD